MENTKIHNRASGILAHISSLPSPYGIGDIGYSSWKFLDFLKSSGQSLWQFLPTVPTNPIFDNSPYMGDSAFAGSPLLLSMELMEEEGLLPQVDLSQESFSEYQTNFPAVIRFKEKLLREAFTNFDITTDSYVQFCQESFWLQDFCLFLSLKNKFKQKGWFDWPIDIANREQQTLVAAQKELKDSMQYYAFEQFMFHKQWTILKEKARARHVRLIGDIPIYVGWDSADVWAHQEIFELDHRSHEPVNVAGVPPDYFSKTGQRWGNPLYRWNSTKEPIKTNLETWWTLRFQAAFEKVDIVRLDHFRGFESYWSVPATHKTALKGKWVKGPGIAFFQSLNKKLGKLEIIAEDLGEITEEVIKLRDDLQLPGMKVLQFAFDQNRKNTFLPCNYSTPNCVAYTGTHDNDTSVGWFLSERLNDAQRKEIKQYCNKNSIETGEIHKELIYLALSSICKYAIIPLQDLLGFGNDCKMNSPGTKEGNWTWRCAERFLTEDVSDWLYKQCELFARLPSPQPDNRSDKQIV